MEKQLSRGHKAFFEAKVVFDPPLEDMLGAFTYYGDSLFLGTTGGKLMSYAVDESDTGASGNPGSLDVGYVARRKRTIEVSKGRAITKIECFPEVNLLIVLCEGAVTLYAINTLDKVPSILESKHAVSFAINTRALKLCIVTSKKRLKLYEWNDGKFAVVRGHPELDVPDVPRSIAYIGGRLIVGYRREYNVIIEETGAVTDIGGEHGNDRRPLIKQLPGDRLLLSYGTKDRESRDTEQMIGVMVDRSLKAVPAFPVIEFQHRPLHVGYCYPYILSIGEAPQTGTISLFVHATQNGRDAVVQEIPFRPGVIGVADGRMESAVTQDAGAGRSRIDMVSMATGRNPVYVAWNSPPRIVRVQPVPVSMQVEEMISQGRILPAQDLLINTLPSISERQARLAELSLYAARVLTMGSFFEPATPFLVASPLDPREYLQLFPDMLIGSTKLLFGDQSVSNLPNLPLLSTFGSPPKYMPYPSRYFNINLTQAIVSHKLSFQNAASKSYDVRHPKFETALSGDPQEELGVASIPEIILSQLESYGQRIALSTKDGQASVNEFGFGCSSFTQFNYESRLKAAYESLLVFLRARRMGIRYEMARLFGNSPEQIMLKPPSNWTKAGTFAGAAPPNISMEAASTYFAISTTRVRGQTHFFTQGSTYRPTESISSNEEAKIHLNTLAQVIDSALMRVLCALGRGVQLDKLLSSPNALLVPDVIAFLMNQGRAHQLALFLNNRGYIPQALEILQALQEGKLVQIDRNTGYKPQKVSRSSDANDYDFGSVDSSDSDDDQNSLTNMLPQMQRSTTHKSLPSRYDSFSDVEEFESAVNAIPTGPFSAPSRGADSCAPRDAFRDSILILRSANDPQVVFEYAPNLFKFDLKNALSIFTMTSRAIPIPHQAVITFLSTPAMQDLGLMQPEYAPLRLFLEYLVWEKKEEGEEIHTQLAREYIRVILGLREENENELAIFTMDMDPSNDTDPLEKPLIRKRCVPGTEGSLLGSVRASLIRLLQTSRHYDPMEVLKLIYPTSLYEEKVLLYQRLGNHLEALKLLVVDMQSRDGAQTYVNLVIEYNERMTRMRKSDPASNQSNVTAATCPLGTLVDLYLSLHREIHGNAPISPYLRDMFQVLRNQKTIPNLSEIVKRLPSFLSLVDVIPLIRRIVPEALHNSRRNTVQSALTSYTCSHVLQKLATIEKGYVKVTRETVCDFCKRRIGDSVIGRYPDGRVVHHYCMKEIVTSSVVEEDINIDDHCVFHLYPMEDYKPIKFDY